MRKTKTIVRQRGYADQSESSIGTWYVEDIRLYCICGGNEQWKILRDCSKDKQDLSLDNKSLVNHPTTRNTGLFPLRLFQ